MTSSFGFELYDKEFKLRLHFEDDYLLNLLGITPSTFVQPIFAIFHVVLWCNMAWDEKNMVKRQIVYLWSP